MQEGLLRINPAIGCKLPPKRGREMQVLGREELQRFLIQAQAEGYFELFLLDLCTGLRRGELLALQWDDLDFKTGTLTVNKQVYKVKGRLQVSVPKTRAVSYTHLEHTGGVLDALHFLFPVPVHDLGAAASHTFFQTILRHIGPVHGVWKGLSHIR